MVSLNTIKLVVWDLDDTFWSGTISEGQIRIIPENVQLVKDLADCGIVNSICSKNDYDVVDKELVSAGIRDFFVFPSVNWESKSARLKTLIERMSLRPANVLFIDDNHFNREEAKHLIPELQVLDATDIHEIRSQLTGLPKSDLSHKRLRQYQVLEQKRKDEDTYSSNEDFLYASNIRVDICEDCIPEIDRIFELVQRSNQLNFTKKRDSKEELLSLIQEPACKSGYVRVHDKYGDYGIVGFYAILAGHVEHFVFSCRTIGQGIEQYVYGILGSPDFPVVGEVRSNLVNGLIPRYINQDISSPEEAVKSDTHIGCSILMKGPCDMSHALMYLKDAESIDTEFTYVKAGTNKTIDAYNHSVHILGLKNYSENQIQGIIRDCPFVDPDMFHGTFFTKKHDIIFLSSLIESVRGIYQNKADGARVVFGPRDVPMTEKANWPAYAAEDIGGNKFTYEFLEDFSDKYKYVGATTPASYTSFLKECLSALPASTTLCIILGATMPLEGCERHSELHRELNEAVISLSTCEPRLRYIAIDSIVAGPQDFDGSIDHFTTEIYYKLAGAMSRVIEEVCGVKMEQPSIAKAFFVKILNMIRVLLKKVFRKDSTLYVFFKRFYLKMTGKKDIVQ